jgi:hypothetical protein
MGTGIAILRAGDVLSGTLTPDSWKANAVPATMGANPEDDGRSLMRALFVGGMVDNSELDLDGREPPRHYPENSGTGRPRYQLHHVGRNDGDIAYAVYAAPGLADEEVERISTERDYARRFDATPAAPQA